MRLLFLASLSLIFWIGCSSRSGNSTGNGSRVTLSEYNLVYELPYPGNSVIAPADNLTDRVAMCVVDTLNDVSVLILNLPRVPQDSIEAENTVRLISQQNIPGYTVTSTESIGECEYLDRHAWNYETVMVLKNGTDSIRVMFYGYLFDDLALVVTTTVTDTIDREYLAPYVTGLKRSHEIR
ncbi:MAG: hypothetical protein K2K72_07220 [Duncaniella sp.]|nr:hypothetical protein [Duncaniella sp.]